MENVEGWEPTSLNLVAGIRRVDPLQDIDSSDDYASSSRREILSLRQRWRKGKRSTQDDDEEEWEAWTMTFDGVVTRSSVTDSEGETNDKGLLVSRTGPVCRVGQRSVAVGFGNAVKVLLIGNERYDDEYDDDTAGLAYRKRNHRR